MNKDELLQELSIRMSSGEITREELVQRFELALPQQSEVAEEHSSRFSVTKMLYVLGAVIVVVGIIIFVSQIWDDIGSFGRIAVTLGLGLLTAAIGSMLLNTKPEEKIGAVFHSIGGMLIPGGALVTLSELSTGADHPWVLAGTFGVIFAFYLALNYAHKNAILSFFAIANGTTLFYLLVDAINGPISDDLYAYLTMVVGLSYLLLGYAFRSGWNKSLIGVLYFFGISGFLGAAFSRVFDSTPWQMLYFFIVLGGLFLAVYLKSRSILVMSTIFLIAHVTYITSEYFADSVGWPISLIFLGFVFIGLGYASINISKKYITS